MEDVIMKILFWLITSICVGVLALLPFGFYSYVKESEKLMDECLKDHKKYECISMLRSKSSDGAVIVPVPVYSR